MTTISQLNGVICGLCRLAGGWLMLPSADADRPLNVVFIIVDDLGFGELGCYGQKQSATPPLDRLAHEGMRFTRFYAGSTVCAPSCSVFITGLHTGYTRVRGNSAADNYAAQTLDPDDDTLVIFTSDSGPHQEGGIGYDPEFFDSNGPLRGIKRGLTDGGIRVPMIARGPGRIAAGGVSDHFGYFGDFMATFAEVAGVAMPPDHDSISLMPTFTGEGRQPQHSLLYGEFYEEGGISQAVLLDQRWKGLRLDAPHGGIQLFDQQADPAESMDCKADHPDIVARVAELMVSQHVPNSRWRIPGLGR